MSSPKTATEIRTRFVDYFSERGHTHVPSSSLVPQNDPTLLFVNAGMNQFKDVFTGREHRPYQRAVSVQRCLRAGGKHNDLDNVGFTPRHHTLFEMLGNFSFGDYFKAEAIEWGWEFLTGELALDPKKLVVTVFSGEGEDAPADEEAAELWTKFLPRERIYRCSAKDNFWQMGDTGPCGPCSEIHLYRDGEAPPHAGVQGRGPAYEDDVYLELWNLVFMQYEKLADGTLQKLPRPSIDTGSGLERVAAAAGGFDSNYGTNLLAPLVDEAKRLAGVTNASSEAPFRVIADHARATAFLIADGVFPDKGGRSYVLRRIMRRAIRHGTDVGLDKAFFHTVVARVVELFADTYPELPRAASTIDEVVRAEEEAFRRTLDRGLKRLRNAIADKPKGDAFDPAVAADLYDTYGFPIDLTGVIVAEHGLALDEEAAESALKARQAEGGRGASLGSEQGVADRYFGIANEVGNTDFVGYERTEAEATVVGLLVDSSPVQQASAGDNVEVVLDRSPFYAESGGQVGDTGVLRGAAAEVEITATFKPVAGMFVHRGVVAHGTLAVGQSVHAAVHGERRAAIGRNHSATHLLHLALRTTLGDHVAQKGSLVAPDRLRFDFSHRSALSSDERQAIEQQVNRWVLGNDASQTEVMPPDQARERGAIGLFGEKYGDEVRVVRIAGDSLELCGGTHVQRAGDIGLFAIVSEGSIAQGVRRIEAVTGMAAVAHVQGVVRVAETVSGQLHAGSVEELPERVEKLQAELKARDKEIAALNQKLATGAGGADAGGDDVAEVDGVKLLTKRVDVGDAKALRMAADTLRDRLGSGVVVLGADTGGKATLLVAVTGDLTGRVHAGTLVGQLATHVEGRGGGRPDLAQAGGPNVAGLDNALRAAPAALKGMLK